MKEPTPTEALPALHGSTRLDDVLLRAASLEGADREAYLAEIADTDPAMAHVARERIAAAEDLSGFLERPAAQRLAGAEATQPVDGPAPAAVPVLAPEDRYELGQSLGEGGMGRVVEAHDRQLGRRVALKLLNVERAAIHDAFLREGRAQARVRHDHVLDVYDAGELHGQPFLSMRHVAGGTTLGEVAPTLSLEHRIRLLIQVAEGLHAAHRQGLLHRDVKPANVLVEEEPDGQLSALVSDFGIATDLEDPAWLAEEAAGTPHYMAPECLTGSTADRRSDVYSLGVTMYKLLAGALPFGGPMTLDVLRQTVHDEPPPPRRDNPDLPAEVEAIILRCMARDPSERYASARAVAEDLQRFLDGEVVEAYAAGLAYRLTRFVLRHRVLVGMAAALVASLLVASVAVTIFALRADAARQRAELRQSQAEELIRFMVVDLQEELEPVSRLAVLDDVASAATEYFAAVPEEELSEDELLRRSRMLYQLGNLRIQQGDLSAAAEPLEESLALNRRLYELAPSDPERLFELGQSWFWVGLVAWERGDVDVARGPFEEYLEVSKRLVEMDPENLDWQLEFSYAQSNLGSLLQAEGKLEAALAHFKESLKIKEHLVLAVPTNKSWTSDLADSHNTVALVLSFLGRAGEARQHYERELTLRQDLLADEPENRLVQSALATTHAYLSKALGALDELERAQEHAQAAHRLLSELMEHDPDNSLTRFKLFWAYLDLGRLAFARGDVAAGEAQWRTAESLLERLPATKDGTVARGALAYHFALAHRARGDSRGRGEVLSALEIFEGLASAQRLDPEAVRWRGWSYLLLASLETSPAAAGAALERAVAILASVPASSVSQSDDPRCLHWARDVSPADDLLAAAGVVPLDPLFCGLLAESPSPPSPLPPTLRTHPGRGAPPTRPARHPPSTIEEGRGRPLPGRVRRVGRERVGVRGLALVGQRRNPASYVARAAAVRTPCS